MALTISDNFRFWLNRHLMMKRKILECARVSRCFHVSKIHCEMEFRHLQKMNVISLLETSCESMSKFLVSELQKELKQCKLHQESYDNILEEDLNYRKIAPSFRNLVQKQKVHKDTVLQGQEFKLQSFASIHDIWIYLKSYLERCGMMYHIVPSNYVRPNKSIDAYFLTSDQIDAEVHQLLENLLTSYERVLRLQLAIWCLNLWHKDMTKSCQNLLSVDSLHQLSLHTFVKLSFYVVSMLKTCKYITIYVQNKLVKELVRYQTKEQSLQFVITVIELTMSLLEVQESLVLAECFYEFYQEHQHSQLIETNKRKIDSFIDQLFAVQFVCFQNMCKIPKRLQLEHQNLSNAKDQLECLSLDNRHPLVCQDVWKNVVCSYL